MPTHFLDGFFATSPRGLAITARCILACTLIASLWPAIVTAYDFRSIADQHILPAYRALAAETQALDTAAGTLCKQPDDTSPELVRAHFVDAFGAWQGVQHLRFGPIRYLSREYRFQLWPDKRGTVRRHLAAILDDPILDAEPPADISERSIAVQGFSALERLLYADTPPGARRCHLIRAITHNLRTMSHNLVQEWLTGDPPYNEFFAKPGPGNAIFESDRAVAGRLLNSLYTQLEFIVTTKLGRPLDGNPDKARGRRAEGWRSQSSLAAITTNLAACRALYRQTFAPELGDSPLHRQIEAAFSRAEETAAGVTPPLSEAVEDIRQWHSVDAVRREISALKGLIGRDMARELDLSLGFNSLDGD